MKIVIPGGSGQIGNILARQLHADWESTSHDLCERWKKERIK